MPAAWRLASPKLGEREVAAELLAHAGRIGALRPGLILIGDKGFAGREFEDLVTTGFGLHLVRPDRRDEAPRHSVHRLDPPVDRIGQRHPQGPARPGTTRRPERPGGLYARITQRLLAMAAAIWHNWATGAPVKRSLITYDN